MSRRPRLMIAQGTRFYSLAFLAMQVLSADAASRAQSPAAQAQISKQAAFLATLPAKVQAKPLSTDITVGSKAEFEITVFNAENVPVPVTKDWRCEATIRYSSGKTASQVIELAPGHSSVRTVFAVEEAGFASVFVRPLDGSVRSDRVDLIVRPTKKSHSKVSRHARNWREPELYTATFRSRTKLHRVALWPASFERRSPSGPTDSVVEPVATSAVPATTPTLHISLSDPNGKYKANGKDAAVITVLYESPDLSSAPQDIHIWLKLSNGVLDPPQPLELKKGTLRAETQITSLWPAEAHLTFVSSTPTYQAVGDTDVVLDFIPFGAALVGPEKLSVIDNSPVMVVFYDAQRKPVAPGKNWQVKLQSRQSKLHFTPASFEVQAGSPSGSSVLLPTSWGNDTVDAVVANYTIQPLPIVITGWVILGLCLAGGVAGGLAAYSKFKGSCLWRIFLGILGGAALCWVYVYLALPNVNVNMAHNTLSVFFVALLGGYGGTSALDYVAKRLGWLTTEAQRGPA
jgi:hypothetical protein